MAMMLCAPVPAVVQVVQVVHLEQQPVAAVRVLQADMKIR
jgi:hypothetical protein